MYAGSPSIQLNRIRVKRYGSQLFIADKLSGRWLYSPTELESLFLSNSKDCSKQRIDALQLMSSSGIGFDVPKHDFGDLKMLIIKLTNACNLGCSYCYDYEKQEKATVLEVDAALKSITEALELCKSRLTILFHGGEPMLVWPFIEQLTLHARAESQRIGRDVYLTGQTNLTQLTDHVVKFSQMHRISWGISFDGPPPINDKFRITRKGMGSFVRLQNALKRWPDFVLNCGVMSTITSANVDRLVEVVRFFKDSGFTYWDWSLFQSTGRGRDNKEIDFAISTLTHSWSELFIHVLEGKFDGFEIKPVKSYIENFFFNSQSNNMCMRDECGAGRDLASISADGTIEACDCIDPQSDIANLGNIKLVSLEQSRQSKKARKIRSRNMNNAPSCGDCIWYAMCGGTCLAYAPSLNDKSEMHCALSLTAFDAIAEECAISHVRVARYMRSIDSDLAST